MSKEDKQRKAATNRLLDILRKQQTSEEASKTEDQKESIEKETVEAKLESAEIIPKEQEVSKPVTDDSEAEEQKEPEAVAQVEEVEQAEEHKPQAKDSLSSTPEAVAEDILLKTRLKTSDIDVDDLNTIPPDDFNSSLLSTLNEPSAKITLKNIFRAMYHRFNDTYRKITIHADDSTVWAMQQISKRRGILIEKYNAYKLPYEYGGETITEIDDLVSHVLRTAFGRLERKMSFGAYFSAKEPSKTLAIETPHLKKKELEDLVEWNSKKNLPFNVDEKVVNWSSTRAIGDSKMRNIVVGVKDRPSIENANLIFDRNGIKLRFTSTLPILLWKSFVKNYPEKSADTVVVVHIGEVRTSVVVVAEHKLLYSREIAIGANDFYKAIMQKITTGDKTIEIDEKSAQAILHNYGFPVDKKGLTVDSGVDIYKVGILLRPVVERITSELNRSLNYFKNQNSELEWDGMIFDGIGASFPNLVEEIQENIFLETEVLNPMRVGQYSFKDESQLLSENQYSSYSINFALASDEVEPYNILPLSVRQAYKYVFRSKLVGAILAAAVPIFIFTALIANLVIGRVEHKIEQQEIRYNEFAAQTQDYGSMVKDMEILDTYNQFLSNDQIYSDNQINILKLFSTFIPEEIKLTTLTFNNAINTPDSISAQSTFMESLFVSGLVESERAISDIHLTDFILTLEGLSYFTYVNLQMKNFSDQTTEGKLVFALNLGLNYE